CNPSDIIIGLPLDTHNLETYITKSPKDFAKEVQQRYQIKVHLINEAYSNREARGRMEEFKSKKVTHIKVDDLAACVIV
ncbi:Holliday junction resolvase RuvX, partial [Francisella tularensis subsp. holarctica]|uniref:RuvX/YqgF family protein n=1 Tax=Francisella tularensis TaxID=263 RepID=UPI002381A2EF